MPGIDVDIEELLPKHREPLKEVVEGVGIFNEQEVDCAMELIDTCLNAPDGGGYIIYVARLGKQVLGYICYGATPLTYGVYDMYWLVVDKKSQGLGIGRKLMEFMEKQLASTGRMVMIETSSREMYERARRLYRSMNYDLSAQIADFYNYGDDKLIFSKRIAVRQYC